jgi:hypothetical protein
VRILTAIITACFLGNPPEDARPKIDYSRSGVQPPPAIAAPQDPTPEKPAEKPIEKSTNRTVTNDAFVIACDSNPSQVIVLDAQGKWISGVRNVEIKFDIGQPASLQCQVYEGSLKPTKPLIRSWKLTQIKTVNSVEFQQMIDELQHNPDGIKSLLRK